MVVLLYPGVKLLAYTIWCYLGLRNFRPDQVDIYSRSLVYGFLRLLMGLFFGLLILFGSSAVLSVLGVGIPQNILT
jgi:hypothetical protein